MPVIEIPLYKYILFSLVHRPSLFFFLNDDAVHNVEKVWDEAISLFICAQ